MSLHKLAQVTIIIEGLPEYTGTDDELQELTENAKELLQFLVSYPVLSKILKDDLPGLYNKIEIRTLGLG